MDLLEIPRWSPYIAGAGIGILSWITFYLSDKALGCSTAFARTAGMVEKLFGSKKVLEKPYYKKTAPIIGWDWMLVIGIPIGAFISAYYGGTIRTGIDAWLPDLWQSHFGTSVTPRLIVALLGGIVMGIGSRWSGGCTSGHGISGTLQLALSGWLAVIFFFIGGIISAFIVYHLIPAGGGA